MVAGEDRRTGLGHVVGPFHPGAEEHLEDRAEDDDAAAAQLIDVAGRLDFVAALRRIAIGVVRGEDAEVGYFTLRPGADGSLTEDLAVRGIHPMVGRRLNLWRLRDFDLTRIAAPRDVLLFDCVARDNAADRRLIALAQVREVVVMRDDDGKVVGLPHVERALANCLEAIRAARTGAGGAGARLDTNQVWIHIWPLIDADVEQLTALRARIAPMTAGAGIQEVRIEGRIAAAGGRSVPIVARFSYQAGAGVIYSVEPPATERMAPLDAYAEKVLRASRRGLVYPYELQSLLIGDGGSFVEYDLDETGALVPAERAAGKNRAGIVCGVVTPPTELHPEGIKRVLLAGDPLRSHGAHLDGLRHREHGLGGQGA